MGTYMTVIYSDEHAQYILKILLKASKYFGSNNNLKNSILQIRFVAPLAQPTPPHPQPHYIILRHNWRKKLAERTALCIFAQISGGFSNTQTHTTHTSDLAQKVVSHRKCNDKQKEES